MRRSEPRMEHRVEFTAGQDPLQPALGGIDDQQAPLRVGGDRGRRAYRSGGRIRLEPGKRQLLQTAVTVIGHPQSIRRDGQPARRCEMTRRLERGIGVRWQPRARAVVAINVQDSVVRSIGDEDRVAWPESEP